MLRSLFETANGQDKRSHQSWLVLFTENTVEAQAALYRNPLVKSERQPELRC